MARLETWYKQDLKKPLIVHKHADVFNQDSRGNLIGVEVYKDGEPVTLAGSVSGYCLLADGTTVPAVGASRSGNKASVLIPQTAYSVPGPITITIKNVEGNDITTLCAVVGLVRQSVSGNLVNPGSVVTDWSNSINAQLQAVQTAADNVGAIVAAPFDENTVYVAGNYVTNNGNLYRITGDHASGVAWADTTKVQCTVGSELFDLKSALDGLEISEKYVPYNDGVKRGYAATSNFPAMYRTGMTVNINGTYGSSGPYLFKISGGINKGSTVSSVIDTLTIPLVSGHRYKIGVVQVSGSITVPDGGEFNVCLYDSAKNRMAIAAIGEEAAIVWTDSNAALLVRASSNISCDNLVLSVYVKDCTEELSVEVIQNIAKRTDNLMPYGDLEFAGTLMVPLYEELVPGTYTISATVITEGVTKAKFQLLKGITSDTSVYTGSIRAFRRTSVTFEIQESANYVYLCAAETETASNGKKVIYKDLQIEKNNKATDYAPFYSFEDSRLNGIDLNDVKTYLEFESGYIDTSGDTVDINNPISDTAFSHMVIDCSAGDEFSFEAKGGNASRKLFAFCDDEWKIVYSSYTTAEANQYPIQMDRTVYTAPINATHLIVNHHYVQEAGFNPKVYKLSKNIMTNYIARNYYHKLPYIQDADWKNKVISTYKNMIAIKDGNKICLSRDCGKTWNSGVDVTGISSIVNAHLYSDGTLAFFTAQKAFYISDWTNYHTATCYEQDGTTVYSPGIGDNFNPIWHHEARKFVNGKDMYVFSNYNLTGSTVRNIIWYSTDNGHTYKIAYEFNVSNAEPVDPDGYTIRHIHDVLYWDTYDKFIVTTGDRNANECMVFELTYYSETDSWSITKLGGSSRQYKWANIELFNEELYYCQDNTPGSIWKCKYQDIGDLSKHTCILDGMNDDALSICFGKRGDMLVVQSTSRNTAGADIPSPFTPYEACRKIYYSSDRKSFMEIFLPPAFINAYSMYSNNHPITTDGHCFLGVFRGENLLPSICVDDYIRSLGYRQAFMGEL